MAVLHPVKVVIENLSADDQADRASQSSEQAGDGYP